MASNQALRVGIFGGAFDPPHWAHRSLAETAIRQLGLDVLHILPTGMALHKPRKFTAASHRLAMCEQAFGDLHGVQIDDREIRREGPSYTADTVAELAAQYPRAELYLMLGADQFVVFKTWSRWPEIIAHAKLAVANRAIHIGADADPAQEVPTDIGGVDVPHVLLDMPLKNISATGVRTHVHGQSRRFPDLQVLVPEGVARYISEHHLYQTPA